MGGWWGAGGAVWSGLAGGTTAQRTGQGQAAGSRCPFLCFLSHATARARDGPRREESREEGNARKKEQEKEIK